MIDRGHALPLADQAQQLGISRGSIYYLPRPVMDADLAIMRRIDGLHLLYPFAGILMARGFVYLVAIVDWFSRRVLAWRVSISLDVGFCIEALARRGKPAIFSAVHECSVQRRPASREGRHQHGRHGSLARQRVCGAPLALGQIRGG